VQKYNPLVREEEYATSSAEIPYSIGVRRPNKSSLGLSWCFRLAIFKNIIAEIVTITLLLI
jgi:hypothetical protein